MSSEELVVAWDAVWAILPVGWTVGRPIHNDGRRERPWTAVAIDLRSRAVRKDYIEATGWTEAEALRDLAGLLREWRVEP